ncbi:MAG: hypothetical protein CMM96_07140 [Rickettsiales bacterium]|nr:hypothetical protein [Rickettsiales bacterium]
MKLAKLRSLKSDSVSKEDKFTEEKSSAKILSKPSELKSKDFEFSLIICIGEFFFYYMHI